MLKTTIALCLYEIKLAVNKFLVSHLSREVVHLCIVRAWDEYAETAKPSFEKNLLDDKIMDVLVKWDKCIPM